MKDTQSKEHIENINKYLILAPLSPKGEGERKLCYYWKGI